MKCPVLRKIKEFFSKIGNIFKSKHVCECDPCECVDCECKCNEI